MTTPSKQTAGPVRLSRSYKVVWGLASLGTSTISGTFAALLTIFYQDYLGLDKNLYGLAWIIYGIWNAINDPLFGYITDGTRSRLGRRIPYMRFTAPFLALAFILVWFAPTKSGDQAIFWWMLATMLLYDTCYTIIGLVYSALLPEVTESDAERNGLQISSSLFGLLGTLLGFLIPDFFRPKAGTELTFLPLQVSMIVIGIFSMLLILATTLKVKERREFTVVDKPIGLGKAIQYTFRSRAFIWLVVANFMSILMQALILAIMFYVADYVGVPTMVLLASLFIPLVIGVPITTLIRARLGVVQTQQLLLVIAAVGLILVVIVPAPLIPVCVALAGFGLSGPQTLTNVLFAQVADEDELRSGVRREGAFFGVNAMITKPAQSLANVLIAFILASTGFITREANAGQIFHNQTVQAIFGIKALFGLIPGLALLLGALALFLYPLRGKYLAEVQQKILALHAEKRAKYEAAQGGKAAVGEDPAVTMEGD
jgi:GPH family glycoside/pentoside/hexuronide:cation symporter